MKKKKRSDTQLLNYLERRLNAEKKPFILWPEKEPIPDGYFVSSNKRTVRACINVYIDREESEKQFLTKHVKKK